MATVTVTRSIAAPIDTVWRMFTDIEAAPDRIAGITSVEPLGAAVFGLGYKWRETRRMMGREATEEMWVSAVDEPRSYEVSADSRGTAYLSRYAFAGTPEGTSVTLTFTGTPHGTVSKVLDATLGWLVKGTAEKALSKDLDDLAAACELP